MIDITFIPADVKRIAVKVAVWTKQAEDDLNQGIVKDAASYIPNGEIFREECIALLEIALKSANAVQALADNDSVKAIFQRVGAAIAKQQHDQSQQHGISRYIIWFEVVFNSIFGGK